MPDHDKPESTPDYASMFANFMPGQSQPPQAEQPPANQSSQAEQPPISESVNPQPQTAKPETDIFLATADKMAEEDDKMAEEDEELAKLEERIRRSKWAKDKSQEEIEAQAIAVLLQLKKIKKDFKKNFKKNLIVLIIIVALYIIMGIILLKHH